MRIEKAMSGKKKGDKWLDNYMPYLLYKTTNKLNARLLSRLRAMKINPSQWRVLSVLKSYGTLSIGEIVEHSLMEQPTISRIVSQLEREGRVTRRAAPQDSRVTEVTLTEAGEDAFSAILPAALRHQDLAFQNIGEKDIDILLKVLRKIERNIALYA